MTSPREIRRSWAAEAMLALVPEGLRPSVARVMTDDGWYDIPEPEGGRDPLTDPPTGRDILSQGAEPHQLPVSRYLEVLPGQNPLKPVIREMETGRIVAGSGRYPKANNPAAVGAASAWKRSKSYREALEKAITYEDEEARFSLERLIEDAFDAAEGSPQTVKCPHCRKDGLVAFKKDGNLIFKLIELLVGKAPQTIEVKGDINLKLQEVMNARQEAAVIYMPKEEWEARERRLMEAGIINPQWLEGEYREVSDPSEKQTLVD